MKRRSTKAKMDGTSQK